MNKGKDDDKAWTPHRCILLIETPGRGSGQVGFEINDDIFSGKKETKPINFSSPLPGQDNTCVSFC